MADESGDDGDHHHGGDHDVSSRPVLFRDRFVVRLGRATAAGSCPLRACCLALRRSTCRAGTSFTPIPGSRTRSVTRSCPNRHASAWRSLSHHRRPPPPCVGTAPPTPPPPPSP